jgi:hypothetical protein
MTDGQDWTTAPSRIAPEGYPVRIRSYELTERIAESQLYDDYAARHTDLGQPLLFRHEKWTRSAQPEQQRPLRIARSFQARLHEPRIFPLVDFFEEAGEVHSVFPRYPGFTLLADVIAEPRLPFSTAEFLTLCGDVSHALAAIHSEGYVHRSLSKHNVLLDTAGRPHLFDLGCAMPLDAQGRILEEALKFLMPWSAAPEQLRQRGGLTPATDIWALGILLYEARYLCHPFRAEATIEGLYAGVMSDPLSFPQLSGPGGGLLPHTDGVTLEGVPGERAEEERRLRPWFARMLEKSTDDRYPDALAVERDLESIIAQLEHRPARARAFVAMPFLEELSSLWRLIEAACVGESIEAVRVDQALRHESIWDEICEELQHVDMMVAVVSPQFESAPNPNVMLEVGYMRALGKPVVLITDDPTSLPFDLRTHRALVHASGSEGDRETYDQLTALLRAIAERLPAS